MAILNRPNKSWFYPKMDRVLTIKGGEYKHDAFEELKTGRELKSFTSYTVGGIFDAIRQIYIEVFLRSIVFFSSDLDTGSRICSFLFFL